MNELPSGWESREFLEVVVLQRGFDLPISARRAGSVAVLGSNGQVGTHDEYPTGVPVPTVTVGRSGSVGKVCFSETGAWPLNTTLFAKDYCGNDPKYIYYWLQHFDLARYAQGVSVPTLNRNSFSSVQVDVPPLSEQRSIVSILDRCWEAVSTERAIEATASELKRVVMTSLLTRGLRGDTQKETEIGRVPESWEFESLRTSIESPDYGHTASAQSEPVGPKFLRITDIQEGTVDWSTVPYCAIDDRTLAEKRLRNGDIVVARIGATTGKAFLVDKVPEAVFASYLIRLRTHKDRLLPEFLYQFMQSGAYWRHIDQHKGGRLKGGVNIPVLQTMPIVRPCLDEQREIVAILGALDCKVVLHRKRRDVLERLFKSLLYNLMTGETSVSDMDLSGLSSASAKREDARA